MGCKSSGKYTITVPLPPKELSPNARVHWAVKSKKKRAFQEEVQLACLKAQLPKLRAESATIQLNFYFRTRAKHDGDNLISQCKSMYDQLVNYGLLADDDKVTHLPVIKNYDKDNPRLEVTIEV